MVPYSWKYGGDGGGDTEKLCKLLNLEPARCCFSFMYENIVLCIRNNST